MGDKQLPGRVRIARTMQNDSFLIEVRDPTSRTGVLQVHVQFHAFCLSAFAGVEVDCTIVPLELQLLGTIREEQDMTWTMPTLHHRREAEAAAAELARQALQSGWLVSPADLLNESNSAERLADGRHVMRVKACRFVDPEMQKVVYPT